MNTQFISDAFEIQSLRLLRDITLAQGVKNDDRVDELMMRHISIVREIDKLADERGNSG